MKKYQYLIKWKRPFDESWMYHVPRKHFKDKKELHKHLDDHTETEGVEFVIVRKLKETAMRT